MKNIKIDGLVYEIPECWKDVSIDLFQDYTKHNIKYSTDIVEEYEILDRLRLISVITRIPIEKLEIIDAKYVKEIVNSLSFLNRSIKKDLVTKISIDGIDLKLIDFKKLKFKDVINIEVLLNDNNPILILDQILAILFDSEEIKDMKYDDKCQKIREQVSIEGVYNIAGFFLTISKIYESHILTYMTLKKLKTEKKWIKWMKVKVKYQLVNTIIRLRFIYQTIRFWILKRFLN